MIEKIVDALIADPRNGLLGLLLMASWIVLGGTIGVIWRVWRAEERQWKQMMERERFKEMLATMQSVNSEDEDE